MLIRGVGVNPADMMPIAAQDIQENVEQAPLEKDMFGPEYEVKISEEGRNLSRLQASQEGSGGPKPLDEEAKMLLSRLEESQKAEAKRWGYKDELKELEKQIKVMNAAYGMMRSDKSYSDPLMKELVEQQRMLREQMQEQKDFQEEEALRRLKDAQRIAAMKSAQGKEEVDENNRDLVALLKTMEEAEKAEDELENGGREDGSSDTSGTEGSAGDAIHNSAAGFMASSLNHEKGVEELSNVVGDSGHWFLSQADSIAQNLLKENRFIKEALGDKSFTNGQIDEMMESYRHEVRVKSEEMYIPGSFGTQVLRDMRDVKLQRISDNPLQSMQLTKDGMMQAAVDAALGEAGQSSIDEASRKLADEVEKLIDERNGMDRTPKDEEENGQNRMREDLLRAKEQEP